MSKRQRLPEEKFQQRKLDPEEDSNGMTEYDDEYIQTPQKKGPYIVEEMLDKPFGLDFFDDSTLIKARTEFQSKLLISDESYRKINLGLAGYARSPRSLDENFLVLKLSLIRRETDLFKYLMQINGDENWNMCFENEEFIISQIESAGISLERIMEELIPAKDLDNYQKVAMEITTKYMQEFEIHQIKEDGNETSPDIETFEIWRGYNNLFYHFDDNQGCPDILATYRGSKIDTPLNFYENRVFNSYTPVQNMAEKFATAGNSQRKVIMHTYYNAINYRLFSSFLVTDVFVERQFELLCLPSQDVNLIVCESPKMGHDEIDFLFMKRDD